MTDQSFTSDTRAMLEVASSLLREDNSEETRIYVQQILRDMRTYLQHKQIQGEEILKDNIKSERESIRVLEDRIRGLNDGSVQEAGSLSYQQMYLELKEEEWMEAFHALLENKRLKIEAILQCLIDILKITYDKCYELQANHNTELSAEAIWAGDKPEGKDDFQGLTKEQIKDLNGHVTYCQSKTAQYCVQSISKELLQDVKSDIEMEKKYKKQSGRVIAAFDAYITACIRFSWVAQFETPPLHLVTAPKTECPPIKDQFVERTHVTYAKLVEWPALVQGLSLKDPACTVRMPWQLYDKSQARPIARPARVPTPPPPKEDIPRAHVHAHWNEEVDKYGTETSVQQSEISPTIHLPSPGDTADDNGVYRSVSSEPVGGVVGGGTDDNPTRQQAKPTRENRENRQAPPTAKPKAKGSKQSGNQGVAEKTGAIANKKPDKDKTVQPHAKQGLDF